MAINKKLHKRTGVEFYYIRFWLPQEKRNKREKAGTTRRSAERLLKRRLHEVADGTYRDPRREEKKAKPVTFGEFAKRFMTDYGSLRRSNYYAERIKFLTKVFGERPLQDITRADLERFGRVRAETAGPSTVRKDLIVAGTMFKRAVRWGVLEVNPAADLEKPREPHHKDRYLSRDEWAHLRAAAPPWLLPILRLAVVTGMRLKELMGLRWEDVDHEAGVLHVSSDNKTGRPRAIPIGLTAGEVLAGQVRHVRSPYVFTDSVGEPYTSTRARNRIGKRTSDLMKSLDLSDATFHTLRHTAGSWAAQADASEVAIARFLGHASGFGMTGRYMHLQPSHLRGIVSALDAAEAGSVMASQVVTQEKTAAGEVEAKVVKPAN